MRIERAEFFLNVFDRAWKELSEPDVHRGTDIAQYMDKNEDRAVYNLPR